MHEEEVASGLWALLRGTRRYTEACILKMQRMQQVYLQSNRSLYSQAAQDELRDYFRAVRLKFYLATLSLEQLWSLSTEKRGELAQALENSMDKLECSDDDRLLGSFALEGFLFQAWAFLYFYMHYICLVLCSGHEGSMSRKKFQNELMKVQDEPFAAKARQVERYFDTRVFGTQDTNGLASDDWGGLLESLRTKVTHRDRLRLSLAGDETLLGGVLFNWPTLQGETYDRFCQRMQNGMFQLVVDISPVLYEVEWKTGPYRPNLWH